MGKPRGLLPIRPFCRVPRLPERSQASDLLLQSVTLQLRLFTVSELQIRAPLHQGRASVVQLKCLVFCFPLVLETRVLELRVKFFTSVLRPLPSPSNSMC